MVDYNKNFWGETPADIKLRSNPTVLVGVFLISGFVANYFFGAVYAFIQTICGLGYTYWAFNYSRTIIERIEEEKQEKKEIAERERKQREKEEKEWAKAEEKRIELLNKSIIKLLKEKSVKMPASDIDAHLKHQNVDEIKELCEEMYHNGKISRTGNYRYFILSEEKKKPKKTSAPKSEEVDVEKELEKLKGLLDKGLIEQSDYDAKKKELLGL